MTLCSDDASLRAREALWITSEAEAQSDTCAAFRGTVILPEAAEVEWRVFGAHAYVVWLDGRHLLEGPPRFPAGHAEYQTVKVSLPAGRHVLAAVVRNEGVITRILNGETIPPFFLGRCVSPDAEVRVVWKARRLEGYLASGQRINPQLGWMEWVDTRQNPVDWQNPDFDDQAWPCPTPVPKIGDWMLRPAVERALHFAQLTPVLIAEGRLAGPFAAPPPDWPTDAAVTWFHRRLEVAAHERPAGVWRRFDLGQVRLGRPEFSLDVPEGAVIEIAYGESMRDGRVTPLIPLSAGLSRNLDHFVARGGVQAFSPMAPKGGRYLEIHVQADPAQVRFLGERYWHRTYYAEAVGQFDCGDERLNRIWQLGIDTMRNCSEDSIIDNPTRERGQWSGDAEVALPIAAAGFNDVQLFRRALRHSAFCADPVTGAVAGLTPGGCASLSTYSAQWTGAVLNFYEMTGDADLLREMYPYAIRNAEAFAQNLTVDGITPFGWTFVDWGYVPNSETGTDMALNLHGLECFRHMARWAELLEFDTSRYRALQGRLEGSIRAWLGPRIALGEWDSIGYHTLTLALRCGLVADGQKAAAIESIKRHIMSCFPNDPGADQLVDSDFRSRRLITPYFAHFSFPVLADAGELDFILDQYRVCWGWGLDQGLTTQPEVFNLNWSHCHVWASSPTAQLSRYVLGLVPHFSQGRNHFDLTLNPGSLNRATGKIPLIQQSGAISIAWERWGADRLRYTINTPRPIWIHLNPKSRPHHVAEQAQIEVHALKIASGSGTSGAVWQLNSQNLQ